MALDNVNHSSKGAIDGNQATGFHDELQRTVYRPKFGDGAGCTGKQQVSTDAFHRITREAVKPLAETASGDFKGGDGVSYWSVSKVLAGRLKGSEASAAEILSTMREVAKFNGKTMAEASSVSEDDLIRVPARYKTPQA